MLQMHLGGSLRACTLRNGIFSSTHNIKLNPPKSIHNKATRYHTISHHRITCNYGWTSLSRCNRMSQSVKSTLSTRLCNSQVRSSPGFLSVVYFSSTPAQHDEPPKKRRLIPKLSERENILNVPNLLTLSRLIAAPIIGYLILHEQHALAVGLIAYASITDYIDGYIARAWNLKTVIGTVLDPLADKSLMTILTITLAMQGGLPVWIAGIILGRDVGMGIAAIYFRWISLPPPKTFARYWDFSLPSAEVRPTQISKINTALQLLLLITTAADPLITADISTALTGLQYLVGTTTVWSGASYFYTKDAVRILPQAKPEQDDIQTSDEPKSSSQRDLQGNMKSTFRVLDADVQTRDGWIKERSDDIEQLKKDLKK